jgi:rhomboid protease GluP
MSSSRSVFQTSGHRLDGTVIPAQPDLETHLTEDPQFVTIRPPRELGAEFWRENGPPLTEVGISTILLRSYCPCCIGPCCSDIRKGDWAQLLKMATFWILVVQLVFYLITLAKIHSFGWQLNPDSDVLLDFGANSREKLQCDGHFHRLLGYILLHGSIFHILLNGLSHFLFVLSMEHGWGKWRFLVIYIASGITGGLLSDVRKLSLSVGASCSIFGVMGANFALILMFWPSLQSIFKSALLGRLIIMPIMFVAVSFLPNVDWLGHLGGLIGGAAVGAILFVGKAQEQFRKWYLVGGIGILLVLLVVSFCVIYLTGNCE